MRPWSDVPASALVVLELGALVLGLALLARLARRAGLSPIPLYLLVGLAFGTGGVMPLSLIEDHVALGADIGVILLMLLLGLQYTGQELSDGLRNGWQAGLVDLALNFTPGLLLGLALGWDPVAAVLLAGVTFNTSSGVMAKVLTDLGRLGNRETVSVLTMSVMEDLINALYLPLVAVLLVGVGLAQGAVSVAVALVTVVVVLIFALRFGETLSRAVINPSEEVVLLTVFGLVLVVAGIAESLQVSSAIGAFLLGIALSGTLADRARTLLAPMRDLFAAVFFVSFGLQVEPASIPPVAGLALALAVATSLTKLATGWWAARRAGMGTRGRFRAGAAFIPRGEFSIVIAGVGVSAGVEPALGPLAAAYVLFTVLVGSLLPRWIEVMVVTAQRAAVSHGRVR